MRLSIFLHIIAVMFFTTAAQAVDYWRPIFFTNQIAIANGSNILSAIYSGNARTKERVRALIGSQVVFYGGTAPRGANANLIVGTNIIVEIEIRPFRDVRPPHSVAWGADVTGTLKSVDFVKRVIHIRAKPEDWKVREGV